MEKIQEGEYMSADPIVRLFGGPRGIRMLTDIAGFDIMGSYPIDDVVLWDNIPNWDGSRCGYMI